MDVVIVSRKRGSAGRISLGPRNVAAAALAVSLMLALAAFVGYRLGHAHMADKFVHNETEAQTVWQREIISQREFLETIERDIEADLSALAGAVGSMTGRIDRLDAVAERIVAANNMDPSEFMLADSPALGGPAPVFSKRPTWRSFFDNVEVLSNEVTLREEALGSLEGLLRDRELSRATVPDGWPVGGGWISSGFGYRTDPVSGNREFHRGLDFAGRPGTDVLAMAAGVVTWSGKRWGYGYMVEINHGAGLVTRYAHNRKNLVKVGDKVAKDQPIALLGSSGRSTGPHVHFEVVRNGKFINPRKFVRAQVTGENK